LSVGAYGLGNYEEAKQLGLEGLDRFEEIGHRWGMVVSMCRTGFPELRLGEVNEARDMFHNGLMRALEFELIPIALFAIGGIASVLVEKGQKIRAAELFEFFARNPATPVNIKDIVEPWSSSLADVLSVEELEGAKARGGEFEFEGLVKELIREGEKLSLG
jgi:hypothetical protein